MLELFCDCELWVGITITVILLTSGYFLLIVFGSGFELVGVYSSCVGFYSCVWVLGVVCIVTKLCWYSPVLIFSVWF